ncbi:uncharacterized protein [Typha angustifolia]|uniref:uncharacterized protein n=1 Tax=Typha angustifolia TaxID=59011 RepID=UPI003C2D59D4
MKLASKVIVLVRDADGFGSAIADALRPLLDSHLTRESSAFDLALDKYGIKDSKASGDLVQFLDPHGSPQVSVLLLPNYEPPVAACVMNEVLALITLNDFSDPPILILPFIARSLKANHAVLHRSGQIVTLYGAPIGATSDFSQSLLDGITAPPPSLQIKSEPLACLLQMVRVLNISTVLLIASNGQNQRSMEIEALEEMGQLLASHINLGFSKESIKEKQTDNTRSVQEPWRELYG